MASSTDTMAPRAASAMRQKMHAFWRWWTQEIAQLVPERFAALGGAGRVPLVAIDAGELVLVEPRGVASPDARVDVASLDDARGRAALRTLLERAGETRGRVRLCLEHVEALVRRVTLPAATEENLRQVLAFEMDRLTPFRAEEVYFDYRVLARNPGTAQLTALLAVARRELVDAKLARLRAWGGNVQGVAVREDGAHGGAPLDLLPQEQRGERESARELLVQRSLSLAVVMLAALALLLPMWQKRETIIALHPVLAKARQEAEAASALASQVERQVAEYNFLLAKKHATYPVLAYVEEVSRLLPDNTYLVQMEVKTTGKTREVQVTGETPSSSKLIEILEQSKILMNATPRGTVTRGSLPNTERFMIVAEAPPRPLPAAAPVLEGQAGTSSSPVPARPVTTAPSAPAASGKAPPPSPAAKAAPPTPAQPRTGEKK